MRRCKNYVIRNLLIALLTFCKNFAFAKFSLGWISQYSHCLFAHSCVVAGFLPKINPAEDSVSSVYEESVLFHSPCEPQSVSVLSSQKMYFSWNQKIT